MDVRSVNPITDIAQAIQSSWAQAGIKLELIPGDGKQTLTKYRARTHDIYIGQWGPDYLDPHTNAETFAINENNGEDAKSKTLAWRNAWDIPDMTKVTQANVLETDAPSGRDLWRPAARAPEGLALRDHVPAGRGLGRAQGQSRAGSSARAPTPTSTRRSRRTEAAGRSPATARPGRGGLLLEAGWRHCQSYANHADNT